MQMQIYPCLSKGVLALPHYISLYQTIACLNNNQKFRENPGDKDRFLQLKQEFCIKINIMGNRIIENELHNN